MSTSDPTTRRNAALDVRYAIDSELGHGGRHPVYPADAAQRGRAPKTPSLSRTPIHRTGEMAAPIYGISMGQDSTSAVLSLRLSGVAVK